MRSVASLGLLFYMQYSESGGNIMGSKAKNYKDNYTDFVADLKEMVELAENKFSERNAFCFERDGEEKSITFSQFANDIRALGTYFYSLGIKNSKIALIGENSYEWIVTYFAAVNGSNVIVPLDKELAYGEAINLIKNSESCALVYSDLKKNIAEECHNDEELKVEHYINMKDFADILDLSHQGFFSPHIIIYLRGTTKIHPSYWVYHGLCCALSLSSVQLFATPWSVAHQSVYHLLLK